MAYIGTPVQQALTKVTSQSFNGTGSQTVFTLNRAVNTGEELEVFVNNVQQEPGVGKSYTATGTTLTFDAAPSSGTGNIYVIYRGLAEVTRRLEHDPNAALAATTGTFSGDLTVDTNTLYVDSTNNRVGVGTTSPSYKTEISDGTVTFGVNPLSAYSTVYAGTTTNHGMNLITNGNSRLNITSGGNVGIGNANPAGKLTISEAAGANAPTTITAANSYLHLGSGDFGSSNNGKFMIGFGYIDGTANTNSPAYMGFEEASTSGDTYGDLTFYTRNVTTDTAPTERMRIDNSGRVTMPYQVGFSASHVSPFSVTSTGQYVTYTNVDHNVGNHYNSSTGIFTCPIAGRYWVFHSHLTYSSGSGFSLYKNSSSVRQSYVGGGNWQQPAMSTVLNCAANDTIRIYADNGTYLHANQYGMFSVHLMA